MTGRTALAIALGVVSAVFIAVQLADGWSRLGDESLPGAPSIAAAVVLLALGQLAIGEAMVVAAPGLLTRATRRWAFHFTQPAKYVPGGVAHVAGVVTALVGRGASTSAAGMLWVVHTGSVIVAGVSVGLLLSPAFGWPWPVALLGVAVPLVLARPVLSVVADRAGRSVQRLREVEVPPQRNLSGCLALTAVGVVLHGGAYAVLAAQGDDTAVASLAAYALALGVSVATPLPAGLGAREAILLGLATTPAGEAIVPVVLVRLLLVAVEVVFWFVASIRRPRRSPATVPASR